jgi:Flp pilus assembly protein CpaB
VDVIVTRDRRANGAVRGPGGSETILRGVRVLAADQPPEASVRVGGFTKGPHQKTAALEVTPRQAELLAGARRTGDIFLSLAALGDVTPSDDGGKRLTPSSLTIIKFGVATKVATD